MYCCLHDITLYDLNNDHMMKGNLKIHMMVTSLLGIGLCIQEMFYLTMHSTQFIYGYMASDIW